MLVQRSMRGRNQPRVVAQAQVVIGACRRQLHQLRVCQAAMPCQKVVRLTHQAGGALRTVLGTREAVNSSVDSKAESAVCSRKSRTVASKRAHVQERAGFSCYVSEGAAVASTF